MENVTLTRDSTHNAHPTTNINKVKHLALIFFDQCLNPIKTSSSVKNNFSKRFSE